MLQRQLAQLSYDKEGRRMKWGLLAILLLIIIGLIWFFFGRPARRGAKTAETEAANGATETAKASETAAADEEAPGAASDDVDTSTAPETQSPEAATDVAGEAAAAPEAPEAPAAGESTAADEKPAQEEAPATSGSAAAADDAVAGETAVGSGATATVSKAGGQPTGSGPYAGSVLPAEDGSSPDPAYTIKGSSGKKFHVPESPYYGRTKAAVYFNTEEAAEAAGFVKASTDFYERGRKSAGSTATGQPPLPPESSFGKGSADPLEDGSSPHPAFVVKGNIRKDGTKKYHTTASKGYARTVPEVWFDSVESARAAGFEPGFKEKTPGA